MMTWRKPGSGACSTTSILACGTSSWSALRAAASAADSAACASGTANRAATRRLRHSGAMMEAGAAPALRLDFMFEDSLLSGRVGGGCDAVEFSGESIGRHRDLRGDLATVRREHGRRAADAE